VGSTNKNTGSDGGGKGLLLVIAAVVGGVMLFSNKGEEAGAIGDQPASLVGSELATPPAAAPAAVTAPDPADAAALTGARHLRLALDAEAFAGAIIYSQNCFASLTRGFSWQKLDQCGAFDALAQIGARESTEITADEAAYFDAATTEARFLAAAAPANVEETGVREHIRGVQVAALSHLAVLQAPAPAPVSKPTIEPASEVASTEEPWLADLDEAGSTAESTSAPDVEEPAQEAAE
jgi:hypothetical protein